MSRYLGASLAVLSYLVRKVRGVAAIEVDERRVGLLVLCIGKCGRCRVALLSVHRLLMVVLGRVGGILIGEPIQRSRRGRWSLLVESRVECLLALEHGSWVEGLLRVLRMLSEGLLTWVIRR